MTAKEIGRELGISHYAVEQHLKAVRKKLGASDTPDAVRLYFSTSDTTIAPYYALPEVSESVLKRPSRLGPTQVTGLLRDIATEGPESIQALSARRTLLAIGLSGLVLIAILAVIVAVAEGVAQLTS